MPGRTYEQSSEAGRERMLPIPYARLEDNPPVLHDPAAVISAIPGTQITGSIITIDAVTSVAILNVARGAVVRQNVRNVITYSGSAEQNYRALNIGDPVYYDRSATMPALYFLSTSPIDRLGVANPLWGWVVLAQNEVAASYPKAPTGVATSIPDVAIMQA